MTDNTNDQYSKPSRVEQAIDDLMTAIIEDGLTYNDTKSLLELQDELKYRKLDQSMEYCR